MSADAQGQENHCTLVCRTSRFYLEKESLYKATVETEYFIAAFWPSLVTFPAFFSSFK